MSGWTILTVRAKPCEDYDKAEYNDSDPWQATADIVATMDADERVRRWTTWNSHVYAYLNCQRYDFEFAESLVAEYSDMVRDYVVLGANDTSDQGEARYYPRPDSDQWTDCYRETAHGNVGEKALAVINSNHEIQARDPWHNNCGLLDERYLEDGDTDD